MARTAIISLALAALSAFGVGCGATDKSQVSTAGAVHQSIECGPYENEKSASKIMIKNDALTCQQAEAFMVLLPDSPGPFSLKTGKAGERDARCRVFPSSSPVSARCHIGQGVIELIETPEAQGR